MELLNESEMWAVIQTFGTQHEKSLTVQYSSVRCQPSSQFAAAGDAVISGIHSVTRVESGWKIVDNRANTMSIVQKWFECL